VRIRGRRITIITSPAGGSGLAAPRYAIDSVCYHMGGPLGDRGLLTSVAGRPCLRCPWHSHLVDLESGEGLYEGERGLQSKGKVQRVHEVEAREDGGFGVRLDAAAAAVRSDEYAFGPKHPGIRSDYGQLPDLDW
jgi:nitrite reductase/ring-hydroxylating ferredoxin subunit